MWKEDDASKGLGMQILQIKPGDATLDRKSTRLNSSPSQTSYAVFCLKKKSWARLDAALFSTEARQLIEPTFLVDSSGVAKIQIQNVSRARLRGLDASLVVTPLPALTSTIAYLFLDARDLATDSVLAFRPKHLLTLSTDYRWRALSV